MSLPPHLRHYVDPNMLRCAVDTILEKKPSASAPKPQYDWRAKNTECQPINLGSAPPTAYCGRSGLENEYVDRPKPKLTRTLGRDGKKLGIVGNVVHYPTGKPSMRHLPSGREANNLLRRTTGYDPNRQVRAACFAPTFMPDLSLGAGEEWGDKRQLPGFGVEQRGLAALNEENIDRLGDGMLPFIRPDLHQWREKPVSYAKPTPPVLEPLIPVSRTAGIHYQAEPIGEVLRFSEPMPVVPGTDGWKRRQESAEHMQLPREERRGFKVRSVLQGDVPEVRGGPIARADETPFEDTAHNLKAFRSTENGANHALPLMLTAIKRIHKKLQQPHTLSHGSALVHDDGDAMATAFDGVRIDVDVTGQRSACRAQVRAKEAPATFVRGYSGADGQDSDFDARFEAPGFSTRLEDQGKSAQRDARATRGTALSLDQFGGNEDGEHAGASHIMQPARVKASKQRDPLQTLSAQPEDLDGVQDNRDAIGSLPMSRRQTDKHLHSNAFDRGTDVDAELSALADRHARLSAVNAVETDDRGRKSTRDAQIGELSRMTAQMATLTGSVDDIDTANSSRMLSVDAGTGERRERRDRGTVDFAINGGQLALAGGNADDIDSVQAHSASLAHGGDRQIRSDAREHQRSLASASSAQRSLKDAVPVDDDEINAARDSVDFSMASRQTALRREANQSSRQPHDRFADDEEIGLAQDRIDLATDSHQRKTRDARLHGQNRRGALDFIDENINIAQDRIDLATEAHQRRTSDARLHNNIHEQGRRGAYDFSDGDLGHGVADRVETRAPRTRALAADAQLTSLHTLDDIEDVVSTNSRQQQIGSDVLLQQQRDSQRSRFRETGVVNQRLEDVDCDVLTNTSFNARVADAQRTDRAVARLDEREKFRAGESEHARDFVADEIEDHFASRAARAHTPLHLSKKYEASDGRESRVSAQLNARMRSETPPPASHLHRNSRFGRMLNASPSSSPNGSRSSSPVRL